MEAASLLQRGVVRGPCLDAVLDVFADIACIVKTRQRSWIRQVLTMPLSLRAMRFTHHIMPGWLKAISHLNPLTLRRGCPGAPHAGRPGTSTFSLSQDYAVIVLTTARAGFIASRLYLASCNVDRLSLGLLISMHVLELHGPGRRGLCGF